MTQPIRQGPDHPPAGADDQPGRRWTVPNRITAARLIGAPLAAALALAGREAWFLTVTALLMLTDWIDGLLARRLHQRSTFGARLDSAADLTLDGVLAFSLAWLRPQVFLPVWPWVAAGAGTYAISVMVCLVKFRRLPGYHTHAAKAGWTLAVPGALAVFFLFWSWPIVVVMAYAMMVNLEAVAISATLSTWQADVPSFFHAWRRRTPS